MKLESTPNREMFTFVPSKTANLIPVRFNKIFLIRREVHFFDSQKIPTKYS